MIHDDFDLGFDFEITKTTRRPRERRSLVSEDAEHDQLHMGAFEQAPPAEGGGRQGKDVALVREVSAPVAARSTIL